MKAEKIKYTKNILSVLINTKVSQKLANNMPDFMAQRNIAKAFLYPEAMTMLNEKYVEKGSIGGGAMNEKCKLKFKDGVKACFKPKSGERDIRSAMPSGTYYLREATADDVDKILGWDLVPTTIITQQDIDGTIKVASSQKWITGYNEGFHGDKDKLKKLVVFDMIIGNQDRHDNNVLYNDAKDVKAIDNGLAFYETDEPNKHPGVRNWHLDKIISDARNPEIDLKIPEEIVADVDRNKKQIVATVTHSLGKNAGLLTLKRINHIITKKTYHKFGW